MGIATSRSRSRAAASPQPARKQSDSVSVASALFSSTQQKVLALLFGHPERRYLTTEVISLCGGGSGGVQRELARLTASGLVQVERVGRQANYQANAASPIFAELVSLVRKTVGLVDPLRIALEPLAEQIDVALVYGSVARGEARASSDVDLLVVSNVLQPEDLYRVLADTERQLGRPVHPTLMTSREFQKRRAEPGSFVQRILGGAVEWLIGGPDGASTSG